MYKGNIIDDVFLSAYDVIPFKNVMNTKRFTESDIPGYVKFKKSGIYLITAMVVATDILSCDASMQMLSGSIDTCDTIASASINNGSCYNTFVIHDAVNVEDGAVIAFSFNESCTIQNAVLTVVKVNEN